MVNRDILDHLSCPKTSTRTAEQSEGSKTVGVDPTVITARKGPSQVRGMNETES